MLKMEEVAKDFQKKHCKQGLVTKVNDYSFTFEEKDKKDMSKTVRTVVYMESYFWDKKKEGVK
jgi:hypothetical protein